MDNNTAAKVPAVVKVRKPRKVSGRNKGKEATRLGGDVNLMAFISETETLKDGTVKRKNMTDKVAAELEAGEVTKDDKGRIIAIKSPNYTLTVEVAKRKVPATKDGKLYEAEYASLLPLTAEAATDLMDGKLDVTIDKDGNESPSVVKYFRQGYGMLARNSAGAAIAAKIEGPEKAREAAITKLIKLKGWDRAKAEKKYDAMMADD